MPDLTCVACGSARVVPDVAILDWGSQNVSPITIQADLEKPVETTFLGFIPAAQTHVSGTLRARICADCGHADLYSPEAEAIWKGYTGEA